MTRLIKKGLYRGPDVGQRARNKMFKKLCFAGTYVRFDETSRR